MLTGLGTWGTSGVSGWIDAFDSSHISGWAVDLGNPTKTVTITLYADGGLLGTASANLPAPDLVTAGVVQAGNSNHRWSITLPDSILDGAPHTFGVKGDGTDLSGSPIQLTVTNKLNTTVNTSTPPPEVTTPAPVVSVVSPSPTYQTAAATATTASGDTSISEQTLSSYTDWFSGKTNLLGYTVPNVLLIGGGLALFWFMSSSSRGGRR